MKNEQKNVEEKVLKKLKSIESDCFQQENHKINEDTISEKTESKDRTSIQSDHTGESSVSRRCLVTLQKSNSQLLFVYRKQL